VCVHHKLLFDCENTDVHLLHASLRAARKKYQKRKRKKKEKKRKEKKRKEKKKYNLQLNFSSIDSLFYFKRILLMILGPST
jgi:PAB1-binding protein PBP1